MIPYEELERALARWKARRAAAPADAAESTNQDAPASSPTANGATPSRERTGEIDLDQVESYDEA
jgi:hypothetical protein